MPSTPGLVCAGILLFAILTVAWLRSRVRRLDARERVYVAAKAPVVEYGPAYVPWEQPSLADEVETWLREVS